MQSHSQLLQPLTWHRGTAGVVKVSPSWPQEYKELKLQVAMKIQTSPKPWGITGHHCSLMNIYPAEGNNALIPDPPKSLTVIYTGHGI